MSETLKVDLAAGAVAFKLRYAIPVNIKEVESQQPEHLRDYFRQKLDYYKSLNFPLLESAER